MRIYVPRSIELNSHLFFSSQIFNIRCNYTYIGRCMVDKLIIINLMQRKRSCLLLRSSTTKHTNKIINNESKKKNDRNITKLNTCHCLSRSQYCIQSAGKIDRLVCCCACVCVCVNYFDLCKSISYRRVSGFIIFLYSFKM